MNPRQDSVESKRSPTPKWIREVGLGRVSSGILQSQARRVLQGTWGSCSEVVGCGDPAHSPCLPLFSLPPQSNKVPVVQHPHHVHPLTPLITYSNEHFTPGNPPPHLPADVDPKTGKLGGSKGLCGGEWYEGVLNSHLGAEREALRGSGAWCVCWGAVSPSSLEKST